MPEFTEHKPYTFSWADLATEFIPEAKEFYTKLFGWTTTEKTFENGFSYSNFLLDGKPIAGLSEPNEEHKALNLPPSWNAYICSPSADETLRKVEEAGGKIIMPAEDFGDDVRVAMFEDPEGVALGVFQPKSHKGFAFKDVHGGPCWLEYASHDHHNTVRFYCQVFGWHFKTEVNGDIEYTHFTMGDDTVAGLFTLNDRLKHLPSHWLPYYNVDDIEKAAEITTANGGKVLMPPVFIEGVGYYARISDSKGGVLGLIQP